MTRQVKQRENGWVRFSSAGRSSCDFFLILPVRGPDLRVEEKTIVMTEKVVQVILS